MTVRLQPIERDSTVVDAARALLVRALPYDRIDVVWQEKLFGDDGARHGRVLGAFEGDTLLGLIASAGRFIKVLAVEPSARRRGVGGALLDSQPRKMRAGDHPGNYLAPGVDERYVDGIAFLQHRGFVERERVENLRVPYAGNPLVSEARAAALCQAATTAGYRIAVPTDAELPAILRMIATEFAAVWANEAARAWRGPRRSLWVAFAGGSPVAFAAADGNNQGLGWFGPAGTLEPHRGKRLGEALLLRCLIAVEGLPEAGVIAWIGPKPFYERAAAAVGDRRFVQLERRDE